ncbi:MAG: hypothetical protein ACRC6O_04705 [Flavobacterium sp.]
MKLLRKIVLTAGILLLFFISKIENNSNHSTIVSEHKGAWVEHTELTNFQFIQPENLTCGATNSPFQQSFTGWLPSLCIPIFQKHNIDEVASRSFLSENINRIISVSPLLFPVHYFW